MGSVAITDMKNTGGHVKCPSCPESFYTERCLQSHLETVHQGQSIICDECPNAFPNFLTYQLHKNMYHPSSNMSAANFPFRNAFQLAALGAMTGQANLANLKQEEKIISLKKEPEKVLDLSSPIKPLKITCPEQVTPVPLLPNTQRPPMSQFTSIEQLTNSSARTPTPSVGEHSNHNNDGDGSPDENDHLIRDMKLKGEFPCRLCDAIFPNLRALKGHNKEHMDRPPYICNVGNCTYTSNDKSTLARHMRTHTGEKPFECTICNFGFTTKANCERHVKNKHLKTTREEVRDSIIVHETTEDGEKHALNTSMTESNGSSGDQALREDTPSPVKRKRHESGYGGSSDRIFAPYRNNMYRPNKSDEIAVHTKDYLMAEPKKQDAPLDLSRPNTGDSLKENAKTALFDQQPPIMGVPPVKNLAMDFTKSLAAMAGAGMPGLPGAQMPFPFLLSHLANATGSFDGWAAYLLAHQQQEALRRQREAEIAAAAMANSAAAAAAAAAAAGAAAVGTKDPAALLMHLSNLQSFQAVSNGQGLNPAPLASSPEKKPQACTPVPVSASVTANALHAQQQQQQQNSNPDEKSDGGSEGDYKMVIKNGVLMKKQKQRRYRTERPHECEHCNARFTLRSNMDRHIKQQHSNKTDGSDNLNADGSKSFEDSKDSEKMLIIDDIEEDEQDLEEDMDDLDEEEEGIDLSKLEAMVKIDGSSKPFHTFFDTSDEEDESKTGNNSDDENQKSAYASAPNKIDCPFCGRTFPWISSMKRHILTHTGQKPFKCPECPLWFTTKSNCDRHLIRKHGNNNNHQIIERQQQQQQSLNLTNRYNVNEVTNGNEGDASSNDEDDGANSSRMLHKVPHGASVNGTDELPFKCYLCDDGKSNKDDALDHLRSLHPEDYENLVAKGAFDCTATEVSTSPLNNEEDTFDNLRGQFPDYTNRRVICLFCMRKFWSAEDLRRHVRTHTGEKPYECDICHRKFTLKHSMLRHCKKHDSAMSSGDDTDSEGGGGGHSSTSPYSVDTMHIRSSSPDDAKSVTGSNNNPLSMISKKKKPSLMDKINQLSSAATHGTVAGINIVPSS